MKPFLIRFLIWGPSHPISSPLGFGQLMITWSNSHHTVWMCVQKEIHIFLPYLVPPHPIGLNGGSKNAFLSLNRTFNRFSDRPIEVTDGHTGYLCLCSYACCVHQSSTLRHPDLRGQYMFLLLLTRGCHGRHSTELRSAQWQRSSTSPKVLSCWATIHRQAVSV